MESPQGVRSEALKSPVKPIIEYDPSLQKEDVPYGVSVDGKKCAELFRELGISDEAIGRFKINLVRKPLAWRSPTASYSAMGGDRINIYTDVLWKKLQKQKPKSLPEKGIALVKKMSGGEFGTPVGLFLHESEHASDFKSKIQKSLGIAFKAIYYGGGVVGLGLMIDKSIPMAPLNEILSSLAIFSTPVLYAADPYEIRARRFADKNRNDPRWQDILTITPKSKQ